MTALSIKCLPKDEILREATLEDYQAVLDIDHDVYDGCDYLPATFPCMLEGQGVRGHLYLKEDRVIGFMATKVVDGDQTVVLTAGRNHRDYRGLGMYGRFKQAVSSMFATTSPKLGHVAFAVDGDTMDAIGQRLQKRFNLIMGRKLTCITMEVDQVRTELSKGPGHSMCPPQPLTYQQLHSMLSQCPSHLSHLFPQQRILLSTEPFRVMADNTDVIVNNCKNQVFAAASAELASIGKGNNFPVTLLSCGGYFPCKRGTMYEVDLFGSGSDAEMLAHLVWHLRRLTEVAKEKSAVMYVTACRQLSHEVTLLQKQFSVNYDVLPFRETFVFEGRLHK